MKLRYTARERAGARADFRIFLILLWRHLGLPDPTPVQLDIAYYLQHGPKKRMVQACRGIGKSYITSAYAVWRLWLNPQEKILVVSASKDRADAFSTFTKRIIAEFPLVRHLRGGERDSNVAFDVRGSTAAHAPSVKSVGITGQIVGSRATVIIPDDVESPNNSLTQTMRDQLSERTKEFSAVLTEQFDAEGNMVSRGDIVYLGTPQSEMTIYRVLPERGYNVRVWPAEVPEDFSKYEGRLAPFVYEMVEKHRLKAGDALDTRLNKDVLLEKLAEYAKSGYMLQFMLDPSLSDAERYPLKLKDLIVMPLTGEAAPDKCVWAAGPDQELKDLEAPGFSGDRFYAPAFVSKEWSDYYQRIMFIDPSGRGGDETGYAVLAMRGNKLFLLESGGYKKGYAVETLEALSETAKRWNVSLILCEPNMGDGMFVELLKPVLKTIHKHCTAQDAERAYSQKELRICDVLEPLMNSHRLVVNQEVVENDRRADAEYQLFYQMTRITRDRGALRRYDRLDALAGACAYFVQVLAQTADEAYLREKEQKLMDELNGWGSRVKAPITPVGAGDRPEPNNAFTHTPRRMS